MGTKQDETKRKLEELGNMLLKQIQNGENPFMDIPIRALSNVNFNSETGLIELGDATSKRFFFNIAHIRKFVQTVQAAAIAKELVEVDKHLSLRQVFYAMRRTIPGTKIDVVDEQTESNQAIEDLELITENPRELLHINANKNGAAAGKITIKDKGDIIDWSKLGSGGWAIPSNTENIEFKKIEAKFVIYMEKAAMWERLHEDRVWEKMNCVIIASQGQATRGIRRLLQRMNDELKLPVYVLTDFDPWGWYIFSVLKFGSISLAHESERLAIPNAKFLGLIAEDIKKYGLEKQKIKFTERDKSRITQMKEYDWFKSNKEWQKQFEGMKKFAGKVELDALVTKGISFISDKYLPEKFKQKSWID
ncbi:MAG TPA: DNA topoisomerase IV subunit A [Candidatus Woesearchaeota archaeon]|nr:DNA topoisomerase IV subunit A [Candidatus Woesearchaeota archaeon]